MRKLQKPILAAIALWEIAAFSGYSEYSPFAGLGGFLIFWVGSIVYRKCRPLPEATIDEEDTAAMVAVEDVVESDQTSIW